MKKSVNPMKFLPHESRIEKMVAPSSAHFIGPFTMKHPKMKSISDECAYIDRTTCHRLIAKILS